MPTGGIMGDETIIVHGITFGGKKGKEGILCVIPQLPG